ncbi:hypothetical protein WICMUC_004052 [Wickerhamomyces mucosus]|uniref:Uncharacterized protein n=1 Tax=Wickerhamomyces mucosus TaxID=1378264 RepID=A0A9P8TBW4_9ASCO|nr:hypothetical protein WICMUC_004052 [Wickerhamomyces mucosus]
MSTDFKVSVVAGGKPLSNGVLFLKDRLHYIIPYNNQLKVYFLTTRQCIRSIKFNNINNINLDQGLCDIKQDNQNSNLIWVFTNNGEIFIINWKEKLINPVIKNFKLNKPNNDPILKILQFNSNDEILILSGKDSNKPHSKNIIKFKFIDDDDFTSNFEILFSIKNVLLYGQSNDSTKLVLFNKTVENGRILTTIDLKSSKISSIEYKFNYKAFITSLAISNNSLLAIGTSSGVIHLIYQESSSTRLLKWHIDQVSSLSFSNDSNYLLSGGLEKVLVFWQLDTEKQQFLPRLNGEIFKISNNTINDDLIQLFLKLDNQDNIEILILSTVDLQSRLSINGPRQNFNSDLINLKKIIKSFNKIDNEIEDINIMKLKYDFTNLFQIHPISKNLYFINGSNLQIFDFNKNEQIYLQKIVDTLPIGKVKSELKILDPIVKNFEFSKDGQWLLTIEEHRHGEIDNLLSKNDLTYVFKIWKLIQLEKNSIQWDLITKIINPHGINIPVTSLISAPESYFKGVGFLTADNNGGVRLWRPNNSITGEGWSLKKLKSSSLGIFNNSTSLTWSKDSSLILLGFDDSIISIDINTFEEIELIKLNKSVGSRIRHLEIIDNDLIILSSTNLKSINLITLEENQLNLQTNPPKNGKNLISINGKNGLIAYVVNYYNINSQKLNSKLFIFNSKSILPIFIQDHDEYITSINWNHDNDFIFIDIKSRIGILTNSRIEFITEDSQGNDSQLDYENEMRLLLQDAQSSAQSIIPGINNKNNNEIDFNNEDEENGFVKTLDINSFNSLFENINDGGIKLETLFERVMQVIN